jgi:hypothetical protein
MSFEREFLEQRFKIVDDRLSQVNEFDVDDKGRFYLRYQHAPTIEYALIREARLLEKLLKEIDEGKIAKALSDWRKSLGEKLRSHREYYRPMQEAYDHWCSLPFPTRIQIPEPPHAPELDVTDSQGHEWVVDEQLLLVLDDMNARLKKWNESDGS